jgi:pimeloyl-ACP methyl ester carboxylesterase
MRQARTVIVVSVFIALVGLIATDTSSMDQRTVGEEAQGPKVPEPGTLFLYPERIPLEDGGFFNAERGVLFVPENRSKEDSRVIAVEVYRFRRSAQADPDTPPIFFLHGGPSFRGLEPSLAEPGTFEELWLPMLDVSGVVVISQRGIGPSKPTTTIEIATTPTPPDQPYDDDQAVADYRRALAEEKAAWMALGIDLSGYTVIEAAEDINDVRRALGYDSLTIWGGSFGSHWGMAFMRRHPELVARAILRGMEGPDHTYDHPGHSWTVYERVAAEAEAAPELAGVIPEGGLIGALESVIDRADKQSWKATVTDSGSGEKQEVLFDGETVRSIAGGYSGGLASWPADVINLFGGDFLPAARSLVRRYENSGRRSTTASFFMLDCGSGITKERLAEFLADPAAKVFRRMNWHYIEGCPVWGSDLGDAFRQNFETEIPTVIAHGTWDTSTPYENALELIPYFKNSNFIPIVRGPHWAIRAAMKSSEEFTAGILHFAATGDTSKLPEVVEMPPVEWTIPEVETKER